MNLKGKIVLITGGAVRVGRTISLEMARAGAILFCHYHSSQAQADSLAEEIRSIGGKIQIFKYDLSLPDAPQVITKQALSRFKRIDVLINNAAVFYKTPLGNVRESDWDAFFTLNLKSAFFLSQEVSKLMLKQKTGKIINIGDAGAESPFPSYLPYSMSKAGIINMTKGLAKALAPHIQVNCVNLGPVMMPESMLKSEKKFALQKTLLKREGNAQDVARAVRFLIEEANYTTGAIIPVDGGRHLS